MVQGIDPLIVDEIGKTYQETGMIPTSWDACCCPASGTRYAGGRADRSPLLTEESHGNANGVGLPTSSLVDSTTPSTLSYHANVFTTTFLNRANIPVTTESDHAAIKAAFDVQRLEHTEHARVVRIGTRWMSARLKSLSAAARVCPSSRFRSGRRTIGNEFMEKTATVGMCRTQ